MQMINKQILMKIADDKSFKDEVVELLNHIIDTELEKNDDDINFDLIDECTDTIMQITFEGKNAVDGVLRVLDSKNIDVSTKRVAFKSFSTALKVAIIAAALLLSTLTVNAAINDFTGKSLFENVASITQNDDAESTTSSITELTTQPQADQSTTTAPRVDDSIFVRESPIPSTASSKVVRIADNSYDSSVFIDGERISYKKKGTVFDAMKLNFNDPSGALPQNFNEQKYMTDHYSNEICDVTESKHTFTKWETVSTPTCGNLGEKRRYCTACSYEQTCPVKATGKHKMTYDAPFAHEDNKKTRKIRATCINCGTEAVGTIYQPKYIVIDTDLEYYNGSNTRKPRIIAVLDKNGYEYPSYCWTPNYEDILTCGAVWIGADFMNEYYADSINARYYLHPAKINLAGITALTSGFNAYWSKSKLVNEDTTTGFQLEYSLSSDFSSSTKVKIKSYNSTSNQVSGLASGKTYYVRIRTYYNFNGNSLYGPWSDVRAVKIK